MCIQEGMIPGNSVWHNIQRNGESYATVDGRTRSGSEDGWGHIREDSSNICGGTRRIIGGVWGQDWTEAGQRAEPAAVHSSTGPNQQEEGGKGRHEETPLCRRPGPGGEYHKDRSYRIETLEEWNGLFTRHGMKLSLEMTEVLHIGREREGLDI